MFNHKCSSKLTRLFSSTTLSPGNLSWCTENAAKDGEGEEINPKCTPSIKAAVPILYSFSAVSCILRAKSFIACLHGPLTGLFSVRILVKDSLPKEITVL